MAKVNVNTELKDRLGNLIPLTDKDTPATVGDVCIMVLDTVFEDEKNEKYTDKKDRFLMIDRITKAQSADGLVDLSASEATKLQERIARAGFTPTVATRVGMALEGEV